MTAWATSICVAEPVEAALQHSMQHSMQHAVDALVTKLRLKLAGRPRPHLAAARINAAAVARAVARLDHALERFTHVRIDEEMQQQRRRAFLGLLLGDELVEVVEGVELDEGVEGVEVGDHVLLAALRTRLQPGAPLMAVGPWLAWLATRMAAGEPWPSREPTDLFEVCRWAQETRRDLTRLSLQRANDLSRGWRLKHSQTMKGQHPRTDAALRTTNAALPTLPLTTDDGFRLERVVTADELRAAGRALRNCLASYDNRDDERIRLVLRDPRGVAVAALEYDLRDHHGWFSQIYGPDDKVPSPDLAARLEALIDAHFGGDPVGKLLVGGKPTTALEASLVARARTLDPWDEVDFVLGVTGRLTRAASPAVQALLLRVFATTWSHVDATVPQHDWRWSFLQVRILAGTATTALAGRDNDEQASTCVREALRVARAFRRGVSDDDSPTPRSTPSRARPFVPTLAYGSGSLVGNARVIDGTVGGWLWGVDIQLIAVDAAVEVAGHTRRRGRRTSLICVGLRLLGSVLAAIADGDLAASSGHRPGWLVSSSLNSLSSGDAGAFTLPQVLAIGRAWLATCDHGVKTLDCGLEARSHCSVFRKVHDFVEVHLPYAGTPVSAAAIAPLLALADDGAHQLAVCHQPDAIDGTWNARWVCFALWACRLRACLGDVEGAAQRLLPALVTLLQCENWSTTSLSVLWGLTNIEPAGDADLLAWAATSWAAAVHDVAAQAVREVRLAGSAGHVDPDDRDGIEAMALVQKWARAGEERIRAGVASQPVLALAMPWPRGQPAGEHDGVASPSDAVDDVATRLKRWLDDTAGIVDVDDDTDDDTDDAKHDVARTRALDTFVLVARAVEAKHADWPDDAVFVGVVDHAISTLAARVAKAPPKAPTWHWRAPQACALAWRARHRLGGGCVEPVMQDLVAANRRSPGGSNDDAELLPLLVLRQVAEQFVSRFVDQRAEVQRFVYRLMADRLADVMDSDDDGDGDGDPSAAGYVMHVAMAQLSVGLEAWGNARSHLQEAIRLQPKPLRTPLPYRRRYQQLLTHVEAVCSARQPCLPGVEPPG